MDILELINALTFDNIKEILDDLTDEQRKELFSNYCQECGSKDPLCQCANDE